MLTREDKKEIGEMITEKLGEFFDKILAPYLDTEHKQNKAEHEKTREEQRQTRENLSEYIKDHEKRISKLERLTRTN